MKLFTVVFLIVAILASAAFSLPNNYGYHHEINLDNPTHEKECDHCTLNFAKPKEGIIYQINSTQTMEVTNLNDCYDPYKESKVTFEIFSIGQKGIVQTIAQEEDVPSASPMHKYLIDKVWANDQAKYFYISHITTDDECCFAGRSGTFTAVDKLPDSSY